MVETNSHRDLTTPEEVQRYLSETPFVASSVVLLDGGISNYTYRIKLQEPYAVVGPKAPSGFIHSMVLKHAEPHVRNSNVPFAVERQDYEVLAFERVPEITSPSSVVSLPALYYEDRQNRVLIISDCGEKSTNLKLLLQKAPPEEEVSRTIGHSLGVFLAQLHTASVNRESSCPSTGMNLKAAFASNEQGRAITAYVTYNRLVETLAPPPEADNSDHALLTPPLDTTPAQLAIIANVAKMMQEQIKSSDDVLTMGDFWPGNLLITHLPSASSNNSVHVDVVDWELAKPGIAGLDIGQFLAEMWQMRVFHPASRASVDAIVSAFLTGYRDHILRNGRKLNLMEVAHVAATHVGAHLIAFTPRVPWGPMELTRQVVKAGVEHILRVVDKDEAWLQTSIIGGLVG